MIIPMYPLLVKKTTYYNYDHTNVIIDMYGNKFKIDANNNNVIPCDGNDDIDDDDVDDKLTIIQDAQQQINAILARCNAILLFNSTIKAFTNQASRRKYDKFFLSKTTNAHTIPVISLPPYQRTQRMMIMVCIYTTNGIETIETISIPVQPSLQSHPISPLFPTKYPMPHQNTGQGWSVRSSNTWDSLYPWHLPLALN